MSRNQKILSYAAGAVFAGTLLFAPWMLYNAGFSNGRVFLPIWHPPDTFYATQTATGYLRLNWGLLVVEWLILGVGYAFLFKALGHLGKPDDNPASLQ